MAPDENGTTEKPGREDDVRRNKNLPGQQFFKTLNVSRPPNVAPGNKASDEKNRQQNRKTVKNDCNMLLPLPLSL
jgi:hypothetical protein